MTAGSSVWMCMLTFGCNSVCFDCDYPPLDTVAIQVDGEVRATNDRMHMSFTHYLAGDFDCVERWHISAASETDGVILWLYLPALDVGSTYAPSDHSTFWYEQESTAWALDGTLILDEFDADRFVYRVSDANMCVGSEDCTGPHDVIGTLAGRNDEPLAYSVYCQETTGATEEGFCAGEYKAGVECSFDDNSQPSPP